MSEPHTLSKYTSFGCYPLFYIAPPDTVLCHECAAAEREGELTAEVNWESPDLYCDECSCVIESAYGEPTT